MHDRLAVLINDLNLQRHHAARRPPRFDRVLFQTDHRGRGRERITDVHRAPDQQAAVKQVAFDMLRRIGSLPVRDIDDQVGMDERAILSGYPASEMVVERQAHAIPGGRLVQRRKTTGDRHRWRRKNLADLEILEVRPVDGNSHNHCAPVNGDTRVVARAPAG